MPAVSGTASEQPPPCRPCLLFPEQQLKGLCSFVFFFFFNDTATTEIYTLSLHDALPIGAASWSRPGPGPCRRPAPVRARSEEHTSELQSRENIVCRLLLEKKKKKKN